MAGDSSNKPEDDTLERFNEGKEHSHKANDAKDERSLANRLANEQKKDNEEEKPSLASVDPTAPARMHGNEPSKGAKIDAEILAEEQEYLKRKGKA